MDKILLYMKCLEIGIVNRKGMIPILQTKGKGKNNCP